MHIVPGNAVVPPLQGLIHHAISPGALRCFAPGCIVLPLQGIYSSSWNCDRAESVTRHNMPLGCAVS
jgi:hypothetical protein